MSAGGFAAARPGHIWKIPSVLIRMPTGPRPVRATMYQLLAKIFAERNLRDCLILCQVSGSP
ncbi:hypothetical protein PGTUg99_030664 [Puccinia graminis f. sp. tritici]|uniref:Uncharacterized protein n=1 Tax=Puccinia graminis f. sp. tritici TaxID=56615 RepID=A0A5B0PRQ1_PUCGR|nr:hypothetical protein PGTUg99_030664 [Puccinia graminis f. sp. tritici]